MHTMRIPRPFAVVAAVSSVALLVAACGGGSSPSGGSAAATQGSGQLQGQANAGGQGNRVPGASGLIAQIDGHTLQVQSTDAQTAVSYTAATKFSQTVTTAKTAVKKGDCVVVRSQPAGGNQAPSGTPTGAPSQPTAVTAASVEVSTPTGGRCTGAGGAFGGGGFGGAGGPGGFRTGGTGGPGGPPTGTPTFGGGAGRFTGGAVTFGEVTSLTPSGFVVAAVSIAGRGGRATAGSTPTATPTPTTRSVTVTETGSTTYTTNETATAKALAVGKCVTARGTTDDTGAVTATTMAISAATNGQCSVRGF